MLESLYIENIGLITKLEIDFKHGLNILTGETGSGKSLIINSIGLLLGGRLDKNYIRHGQNTALIEATFSVNEKATFPIDIDDDNLIIISRRYVDGKITNKANGRTITLGMLKIITQQLLEFHGQYESHELLSNNHVDILDRFCKDEIYPLKHELAMQCKLLNEKAITSWEDLELELIELNASIDELEMCQLKFDEDETLKHKLNVLYNSQKIIDNMTQVFEMIYASGNARDKIARACKILNEVCEISNLNSISEVFDSILIQLDDISTAVSNSICQFDNAENVLEIEQRLSFLYDIKLKYKQSSVNELITLYNNLIVKRDELFDKIKQVSNLEDELRNIKSNINNLHSKIYNTRTLHSKNICNDIMIALKSLGMPDVKLDVAIEFGTDNVEFMIATNKGEEVKPLSKVSSGGEMSRIMLAIKTILAGDVSTLIFDEIDTGVSGRIAQKIAEKLHVLSINRQVICITHLPQIASMADVHFQVEKYFSDDKMKIATKELLTHNEMIEELAKLSSGNKITDTTIELVKEMKHAANAFKHSK